MTIAAATAQIAPLANSIDATETHSDEARLPAAVTFCLALLAAVSFKFFLAIQIGPETYQAAIAMMAEGSWAERLASHLLMLDGVSQALLGLF